MRIGVNTRFLLKDGLEGIGVYTKEIVSRMVKNHPEIDFVFFFDRPYDDQFIFGDNVTPVVVSPPARHPILWKIWFDWAISRQLKKHKIDVFFSPDGYLSLNTSIPQCVTIHDLAFEHFPEGIGTLVKKYYKYYTPKYASKAKHIFSVSEYTKSDIISTYKIDKGKISLTYNSVDFDRFRSLSDKDVSSIKTKYTSGDDYFLYVGAQHPRKNIVNLLKSFEKFKSSSSSQTKLVLVGRKAWGNKEMEEVFEQSSFKSEILFTGRVSDDELVALYGGAKALVYVPFFEGFGIPIIEAQATGTGVITSNVSSMPEVLGDAGILVDPYDVNQISEAMKTFDENHDLRVEYENRGKQNVLRFDWNSSANHIVETLKELSK